MPEDKKPKIPKGWIPLTKELAKGRYTGDLKGMYYNPKGASDGGSAITYFEEPPSEPKPKAETKITTVKGSLIKRDMTPTADIKAPENKIAISETKDGNFAVDYFDIDENDKLVPKSAIFKTAKEADSFVELRKKEGMFYGPSMTRRGVTEDEAAKRVASKSSYSQYRKIGTGKEK
jgi:hypothetical protein